jgi:hypothetical protein
VLHSSCGVFAGCGSDGNEDEVCFIPVMVLLLVGGSDGYEDEMCFIPAMVFCCLWW